MLTRPRIKIFRDARDARWSTKDKLEQYRGVLKLHAREKKLRLEDAVKFRERISRQLGSFRRDLKSYREIVNEVTKGTPKGRVRCLLQSRKELRLKCSERGTEHVCATIHEENCQKRGQLDRLRYEKKRKLKRCLELQAEEAELRGIHVTETVAPWPEDRLQQRLVSRYQKAVAKQNAAKAINLTYAYMLGILKKDAMHHETILEALKLDRRSQCEVIVRATTMGQLAAEETDDVGSKCKRVARNVWISMKQRERTLELARGQVEDLWSYARSLIRTESETALTAGKARLAAAPRLAFEMQINTLEETLARIKDSLLVRSYAELLSRLEEQARQRTRLLEQFHRNVTERDTLLRKKNEALSELSELEHCLLAEAEECNADRNILLEQLAVQRRRELERKERKRERGELLMAIRAALQNMVTMLVCIQRGSKPVARKGAGQPEQRARDMPIMEPMDTEGLALLSTVSRKVGVLFGLSNFIFDDDREERARDLYQTYVSNYRSKLRFEDEGIEPTTLVVEHEAVDASIPTRPEIKFRSKQAVEAYLRLE